MKQDDLDKPSDHGAPTMQEMFMQYPVGTDMDGEPVTGYRQTKNRSALIKGDGKFINL